MRLVEGEKDYTDFDALLLVSMNIRVSVLLFLEHKARVNQNVSLAHMQPDD